MRALYLIISLFLTAFSSCGTGSDDGNGKVSENYSVGVAYPNLSFSRPVDYQAPPDDSNLVFVVEQEGRIKVFENDKKVNSTNIFLDITDRVLYGGEQGLLGLAFHPDYKNNGYFYVDYTTSDPRRTVIARYQVDPNNPERALKNSEQVLLEVEQPYSNHNGGKVVFGPDGYLYVGFGDGGSGGDPRGNGQNRNTLLGSIIRIDVDHPDNGKNYGIPADNPFVGADCGPQGCREEIFAYGLRNPWRFSFDSKTGTIWVGDVGQNAWEEVDTLQTAGNYGWNVMEGNHCYSPGSGCNTAGLITPVWEYSHSVGNSITGGIVYRGSRVPGLQGKYLVADYGSDKVWALTVEGPSSVQEERLPNVRSVTAFGTDRNQEVYLCSFDGHIYTIQSSTGTAINESADH